MFVFPVAATVVAAVFAVRCFQAARSSAGTALVVWSIALWQFAFASAALAWGVGFGWSGGLFRAYYLFGAVLNVGWLALGTIWLLATKRLSQIATAIVSAASTVAGFDVGQAPLATAALGARIPRASLVLPGDVRLWSRIFSIGGAAIVVAGLLWSIARRRSQAGGLGLLALGVAIVGVAGEFARAGLVLPFSTGLAIGITVMYGGFSKTRR